jgi:hypothetical protein
MPMFPANDDGKHVGVPDLGDEEGISDAHSGLGDLGLWEEDCRRSYFLL